MSASHEFEQRRLEKKIEELMNEQEHLTHQLMRMRREEQTELDRLRRSYEIKINSMETRQNAIIKEVKDRNRELERLQMRIEDEQAKEAREKEIDRHRSRLTM